MLETRRKHQNPPVFMGHSRYQGREPALGRHQSRQTKPIIPVSGPETTLPPENKANQSQFGPAGV